MKAIALFLCKLYIVTQRRIFVLSITIYNSLDFEYNIYVCQEIIRERRDGNGLFSIVPSVAATEF